MFERDSGPGPQPLTLPVLPLRDVVVFPHMVIPLFVGRAKSISALERAQAQDKKIFLVAQKDAAQDDPGIDDIYQIGTVSTILQLLKLPDGTVKVLVEGVERAEIESYDEVDDCFTASVVLLPEVQASERESDVISRSLLTQFEQYVKLNKKVPQEIVSSLNSIDDAGRLAEIGRAHV